MMGMTMVIFLMFTAAFMPWKDERLAQFDNLTSFMVVIACSCGVGIVHLGTQLDIAEAAGDAKKATALSARKSVYQALLTAAMAVALASFFFLIVYCVWWTKNMGRMQKK